MLDMESSSASDAVPECEDQEVISVSDTECADEVVGDNDGELLPATLQLRAHVSELFSPGTRPLSGCVQGAPTTRRQGPTSAPGLGAPMHGIAWKQRSRTCWSARRPALLCRRCNASMPTGRRRRPDGQRKNWERACLSKVEGELAEQNPQGNHRMPTNWIEQRYTWTDDHGMPMEADVFSPPSVPPC